MNADEAVPLQQLMQRSDVGESDHWLRHRSDAFERGEQPHHPVAAASAKNGTAAGIRQCTPELAEPPRVVASEVAMPRQHPRVVVEPGNAAR